MALDFYNISWFAVNFIEKGTVKILKLRTPENFAVITLTVEQDGFSLE